MFRAPEVPVKLGFPKTAQPQTNLGYMTLSADSSGGGRRQGGGLFSTVKTRKNRHFYSVTFEYFLRVERLCLGKDRWDIRKKEIFLPNLFAEWALTHTSQLHYAFLSIFNLIYKPGVRFRKKAFKKRITYTYFKINAVI